jgi:hypothetical protein
MTDIKKIQDKVQYSKDSFQAYLNSLVGPGAKVATARERELFNLTDAYSDGIIRREELNHLRYSFNNVNFKELVAQNKITYNERLNKLEYKVNAIDFNRDGFINIKDKDAVNYVINYFTETQNTLNEILALAGNKDATTQYHIKSWAILRGLEEGTEEHDAFVDKFYNQYYKNPEVSASMAEMTQLIKLYDIGVGQENLADLDNYMLMLKDGQPLRLLADMHRFISSENFDVPDDQRQEAIDGLIAVLLNKVDRTGYIPILKERQKLVADAITRRKIPILDTELTATNLIAFVERTKTKADIVEMRLEDIAKNNLKLVDLESRTDDEYDIFMNKFFNQYYVSEKDGLDLNDLNILSKVYGRLRQVNGEDFNIDQLDIYAYALETNSSKNEATSTEINLLMNLERKSEEVGLTAANREETLKKYIDILTGLDASDKKLKRHLTGALRTHHIPVTGAKLADVKIDGLNEFLNIAVDDAKYLDLYITELAKKHQIEDNPANPNDTYDRFLAAFRNMATHHSPAEQISKLSYLSQIYDGKDIDLDQLNILSIALKDKTNSRDINALVNFYKSDKFNTATNPTEKLREYAEILSGQNKEKQALLSQTLRTGFIPYSTLKKEEVSLREIDAQLTRLDEENGLVLLKTQDLARKSGIDEAKNPTEFNRFVTTVMDWNLTKNLKTQDIALLTNYYAKTDIELDDLDVYVNAIEQGVKAQDIATLLQFETSDKFDLIGAGRDQKINEYISLLAKPAESNVDLERKNFLLYSIRANKIYLTDEDLTIENLDSILARTTTEEDIFNIQSDNWAQRLDIKPNQQKYREFKDSVSKLKFEDQLNTNSIVRSIGLLQQFPDLNFDDFESIANKLSNNRRITPEVRRVLSLVEDENFMGGTISQNYKSALIAEYLGIITDGNKFQRNVLKGAINSHLRHRDPDLRIIPLTKKKLTIGNLEQALRIAEDENNYREQELRNYANTLKEKDKNFNTAKFMRIFYDEMYLEQQLSIDDIRYLAGFYSNAIFSDAAFNEVILAQKQRVSPKALRNLEQYTKIAGLTSNEQIEYLKIMRGEKGKAQQDMMIQIFTSRAIPIANKKLF